MVYSSLKAISFPEVSMRIFKQLKNTILKCTYGSHNIYLSIQMDIYKYWHMFLHCNIQCCIHLSLMYHCMLQDQDTDRSDKCHMEHSLGSIMTVVDSVCLLRKLLYNCSIATSHLGYMCHMLLVWLYNLTHKERLLFSYRGVIVIVTI